MRKGDLKQEEILTFLKDYIDNYGFPPSYREIANGVGIKSTNYIKKYIDMLVEKGLIIKHDSKNRCIEVVKKDYSSAKDLVRIPLVGRVAAGIPILAEQNIEDEFIVSKSIFGTSQELFMLRVQGDSMIEIGIDDGDYVVVKRQENAENGDIVVAYIDGYATVKNFYKEGQFVRLKPQNPLYQPIITNDCKILGKVVGTIKRF